MVIFGPHGEELDSTTPPFYVSVVIHDLLLHNCMLDSGASHNILPLSVMEQLGLQTTRTSKGLYSFNSMRLKCLGMIKDLVVKFGPDSGQKCGDGHCCSKYPDSVWNVVV